MAHNTESMFRLYWIEWLAQASHAAVRQQKQSKCENTLHASKAIYDAQHASKG